MSKQEQFIKQDKSEGFAAQDIPHVSENFRASALEKAENILGDELHVNLTINQDIETSIKNVNRSIHSSRIFLAERFDLLNKENTGSMRRNFTMMTESVLKKDLSNEQAQELIEKAEKLFSIALHAHEKGSNVSFFPSYEVSSYALDINEFIDDIKQKTSTKKVDKEANTAINNNIKAEAEDSINMKEVITKLEEFLFIKNVDFQNETDLLLFFESTFGFTSTSLQEVTTFMDYMNKDTSNKMRIIDTMKDNGVAIKDTTQAIELIQFHIEIEDGKYKDQEKQLGFILKRIALGIRSDGNEGKYLKNTNKLLEAFGDTYDVSILDKMSRREIFTATIEDKDTYIDNDTLLKNNRGFAYSENYCNAASTKMMASMAIGGGLIVEDGINNYYIKTDQDHKTTFKIGSEITLGSLSDYHSGISFIINNHIKSKGNSDKTLSEINSTFEGICSVTIMNGIPVIHFISEAGFIEVQKGFMGSGLRIVKDDDDIGRDTIKETKEFKSYEKKSITSFKASIKRISFI